MSAEKPKVLTDNMVTIICVREYAAAHEKFLFSLQDKYDELAKYAQRKDASQFVIERGNRELKEAAEYMNKSEAIIKELMSCIRKMNIEKQLVKLRRNEF